MADKVIQASSQEARIVRFAGAAAITCHASLLSGRDDAETTCSRLLELSIRVAASRETLSFEYAISAGARYLLAVASELVTGESVSEDWSTSRIVIYTVELLQTFGATRGAIEDLSGVVEQVEQERLPFSDAMAGILRAFDPLSADSSGDGATVPGNMPGRGPV